MSEELFLDRCANPSPLTLDRPALADGYTELSVPLPQLQRLRALRDALVALKGPWANVPNCAKTSSAHC